MGDIGSANSLTISIGTQSAQESNAWSGPGSAAGDFRSDVVTTPTTSMLRAIQQTTLADDVYMEDPTTTNLESYLAQITHHEAALFVLSGTMSNQLAMRSHLAQPPHSVLRDHRAHILRWEAGGVSSLCGAHVEGIVPSNDRYLTLEDIKKHIVLDDDVDSCPTRVIALENTIDSAIMPLSEARRISAFARSVNVRLHLDGARLWEAVVAGAGSLPEYTSLFDSVSLCFSKGLGAPVGSILVGTKEFIRCARWVRKSIGGGLRQSGVVTAAARVAVDETFGTDPHGKTGLLHRSHLQARKVADMWTRLGGRLEQSTETNMVWLDFERSGNIDVARMMSLAQEKGLKVTSSRLAVHYQISHERVVKLEEVMAVVLNERKQGNALVQRGKVEMVEGQSHEVAIKAAK